MLRAKLSTLRSVLKNRVSSFSFSTTAAALNGAIPEYHGAVKFFHWTMGGSMLAAVGLVLAAQNTKVKEEKTKLMFWHKSFGLLAAGLLAPRLLSIIMTKHPGQVIGANKIEAIGASIFHKILIGFYVLLPATGVVMGLNSGFGLPFFVTTIPSPTKNPAVAKQAFEYHKILGQIFEYLIPLHIAGGFYHVFRGHTIFARILPGLGNGAATKTVTAAVPK